MLFKLIENNFVGVIITLLLILFASTNHNFEKKTNRLFIAATLCILVLIITEAWEAELAFADTFTPMRTLLSAIGYTLRPIIPCFIIMIFKKYEKAKLALLAAPLVFNAIVSFSAFFCNWSYGYTAENEFVRGPLGYTPFWVAAFYIFLIIYHTGAQWGKGEFKETLIVSAIALLAFISTVLESIFGFQFIQNPCMATSITFYYMFLHSNQNNRDQLTGALTRRRFYIDADKHRSSLTAVISIDLNNLKELNDRYGHIEGDKALYTVTQIIKRKIGSRSILYRTGGDEFMVLCCKQDEDTVKSMIDQIRRDLEKTEYRCAIGYAICSPQVDFNAVCQIADKEMYEDKRRMKGEKLPLDDEDERTNKVVSIG